MDSKQKRETYQKRKQPHIHQSTRIHFKKPRSFQLLFLQAFCHHHFNFSDIFLEKSEVQMIESNTKAVGPL
jgi:hypothetical protein